jgi:hypothetical protein
MMMPQRTYLPLVSSLFVLALLGTATARATDNGKVVNPLGRDLSGWKCNGSLEDSKWAVGLAKLDPDNERRLIVEPLGDATPELITCEGHGQDIYTEQKFGDCVIELELMVPLGSNSGIYLMGEYEVQVLDSYGREQVGPGDIGGLYGAQAPSQNAAKKPGQWQKFVIDFQAPRFDGDKKTAKAKFRKVTLNGKVIHENVEMQQQTPGGVAGKEAPTGPLMFQGNHGGVAYRNIKICVPAE